MVAIGKGMIMGLRGRVGKLPAPKPPPPWGRPYAGAKSNFLSFYFT